ncbi:MAG: hypothetical protein COZ32_02085, partial [Nitrospirae bacterium CG_4_10_14_3_um_filter_53_41]
GDMKNNKFLEMVVILIVVLAFTPFIQGGCGGGGGGGGGNPASENTSTTPENTKTLATLNASSSSHTTDILQTGSLINDAIESFISEESVGASSSDNSQPPLFKNVQRILNKMHAESRGGKVNALGSQQPDTPPESCEGGGTVDLSMNWDGPNGDIDISDCSQINNLHMTITMNNCVESGVDLNGTMDVTVPGSSCAEPSSMSMTLKFNGHDSVENYTADFDATMNVTDIVWDQTAIAIQSMKVNVTGTISGDDAGTPFSETYDNFMIGFGDTGSQYQISMDGFVQTTCMDGWVQVTTQEPVLYPYDFSCPTGGQVSLHGNGDAVISIHSDSSIDITVNGTTTPYISCQDVPACNG